MKNNQEAKNNHISSKGAIIISLIALGCSLLSLALASSKVVFPSLEFSYEKLASYIGLLFSVVGVVITLYFIILGVSANNTEKEIRKTKEYIDHLLSDSKDLITKHSDMMYFSFKDLEQARCIFTLPYMSRKNRENALALLGNLSKYQEDIDGLQKIIDNPNEDNTIQTKAKGIQDLIKKNMQS